MTIEVRRFTPGDFTSLLEVFSSVYSANPLLQDPAYLEWQFRRHPWNLDERYTLWLLTENDTIKGFYGWVPVELVVNEQRIPACEPLMWWVDPSVRFHGVQLLRNIIEAHPAQLYHSCSDESLQIFRAMGMKSLMLPRYVAILDSDAAVQYLGLCPEPAREAAAKFQTNMDAEWECVENPERLPNDAELGFAAWPSVKSHLRYTGAYLNWRYLDIPSHDYRILTEPGGGWGVFRSEYIKGHEVSVVKIVEWAFDAKTSPAALARIARLVEHVSPVMMEFSCTSECLGRTLTEMGFNKCEHEPWALVPRWFRPLNQGRPVAVCMNMPSGVTEEAMNPAGWYLTRGNADSDRQKQ